MATANLHGESTTINSEAFELLECFAGGLDELVLKLAENIAAKRQTANNEVEVGVADIQSAAQQLVKILQTSDLPDEIRTDLDVMLSCFKRKLNRG